MLAFVEKHMRFVRTTEEFFGEPADGSEGGLWVSGEDGDTYKGYHFMTTTSSLQTTTLAY